VGEFNLELHCRLGYVHCSRLILHFSVHCTIALLHCRCAALLLLFEHHEDATTRVTFGDEGTTTNPALDSIGRDTERDCGLGDG
jgi:hypothetical protein